MSFSQAVSGLGAASSNLDVIGNNIVNSATAGFKSSTIAFADMFAGSNVGLGTKVAAVIQNFNDGSTTTTSRGLDVALSGHGFFRMTDTSGAVYYSRNGQFTLDANRNLINTQGLNVTGHYPCGCKPGCDQYPDRADARLRHHHRSGRERELYRHCTVSDHLLDGQRGQL